MSKTQEVKRLTLEEYAEKYGTETTSLFLEKLASNAENIVLGKEGDALEVDQVAGFTDMIGQVCKVIRVR